VIGCCYIWPLFTELQGSDSSLNTSIFKEFLQLITMD
jgi:hypothetical protein